MQAVKFNVFKDVLVFKLLNVRIYLKLISQFINPSYSRYFKLEHIVINLIYLIPSKNPVPFLISSRINEHKLGKNVKLSIKKLTNLYDKFLHLLI